MKEVLQYYLKICQNAWIDQNELLFDLGKDFVIIYSFKTKGKEEYYSTFETISDRSDIENLLNSDVEFSVLTLKGGFEQLNSREDISVYTDARSITNEMFSLIRGIKGIQNEFYPILNYTTEIEYSDPMCGDYEYYLFKIEIDKKFWWNLEFAKYISSIRLAPSYISEFYSIFFHKNQPIKDDKKLPILSTNTKVRRLGYFKILSLFLEENKQIPNNAINKRFETFCSNFQDDLNNSEFGKGLIKETKNGISAKPYIEMACDLELINKINNIFHVGKSLKVYQALKRDFSNSSNIFKLTAFDKVYLLECILRYDYFYFINLLELIYINQAVTYSLVVHEFQSKLVKSLNEYKRQNQISFQGYKSPSYNTNRKVLSKLDTVLDRIGKWEKPGVYLEHLIMPRLNWMLDFGIISYDSSKSQYSIAKPGEKLFNHLCIWNDINTEKIVSPNKFLDNFIIHLYDDCFNENSLPNPKNKKLIVERIYKHIGDSFEVFRTLAPNRVTASQAANYTKYKLYLDDNIKVGYSFILNKLSEKEQDIFIFKYQEQYQDGYIQKKNN